jgi:hypothetical protein
MTKLKSNYETCVACSGELHEEINVIGFVHETCQSCGGHHYTVCFGTYSRIDRTMKLVDDGFDNAVYFDIVGVDDAGTVEHRTHGWFDRKRQFNAIVQLG